MVYNTNNGKNTTFNLSNASYYHDNAIDMYARLSHYIGLTKLLGGNWVR